MIEQDEYYHQKYLKYKTKYLTLETQVAGGLFDVFKSMNGHYFIFHKNVNKTEITHTEDKKKPKNMDDKIQKMIPDEENSTNISIGLTDIPMFMKNVHQINSLFKDAIILRLYKNKDKYMCDICEYIYYGSKKRTLTIDAKKIIKFSQSDSDNYYFPTIDVFVSSLNLNDNRLKNTLLVMQMNSIIKLCDYYEKEEQNIDGKMQTLIHAKKVAAINFINLISSLKNVFIVSNIDKKTFSVSMNIKNMKIQ